MSGASSAFVSRGRCSEIAEPERGGYQGAVLYFYDFETGDVYQPFEKKRNVVYSRPEFADGYYYFLQGDYDAKTAV
jgi:hypothetical protein